MQIEIPEDKKEIAIDYIRGIIEELDREIEKNEKYIRIVLEELDREIEKNEKEATENGKEQE